MVLVLLNISLECRFGATKKKRREKNFFLSLFLVWLWVTLDFPIFFISSRAFMRQTQKEKRKKIWGGEVVQKSIQKSSKKKKKKKNSRDFACHGGASKRDRETERDTERDGE